MGLIVDFFVASPSELAAIEAEGRPAAALPSADLRGATPVEVEKLRGQILGLAFDPKLPSMTMIAGDEAGDGPWTFLVEQEFMERLAALLDSELDGVGAQWASIDEFQRVWRIAPDRVHEMLRDLTALARRSATEKKNLYAWLCL